MLNIYTETVVFASARPKDRLLLVLLSVAIGVFLILTVMFGIWGAIALAAAVFAWVRVRQNQTREYEYVHSNDIFDVDVVIGNSRRKHLHTVALSDVRMVAQVDSPDLPKIENAINYAGDENGNPVYIMVYTEKGHSKQLRLRLDDAMRRSLRKVIANRMHD